MKDDVKFKVIASSARLSPQSETRPPQSSLVNLDVFLHAAIGDRKHDPQTDRDDDAHARPKRADRRKNTFFPERHENAGYENHVTDKVQTRPFHDSTISEERDRVIDTS